MVDSFRIAEAILLAVLEEPGLTMSLPAFTALLMATFVIAWRAQRIG